MNSGEVEDFVYNVDLTKDCGDLGSPYPTTVTQNGPRHVITNNPVWLGNTAPDFETNGQPSNNADADDLRLTDDEDGVVFPTLFPGFPAEIQVSIKAATSQTACLSGFVDWTGSGTLSPLEYVEINAAGPGGTLVDELFGTSSNHVITAAVPTTASTRAAFHFRVTAECGQGGGSLGSRRRVFGALRRAAPLASIIVIGNGTLGGPEDRAVDVRLQPPVAWQEVAGLLEKPRKAAVVVCGPFRLCISSRTLAGPFGEARLSPVLCDLMACFMRHPGEVLTRQVIMQEVWRTSYVGDTRTLDVHVSWLRKVVEPEPARPVIIVTQRGVGYMFVPGE